MNLKCVVAIVIVGAIQPQTASSKVCMLTDVTFGKVDVHGDCVQCDAGYYFSPRNLCEKCIPPYTNCARNVRVKCINQRIECAETEVLTTDVKYHTMLTTSVNSAATFTRKQFEGTTAQFKYVRATYQDKSLTATAVGTFGIIVIGGLLFCACYNLKKFKSPQVFRGEIVAEEYMAGSSVEPLL